MILTKPKLIARRMKLTKLTPIARMSLKPMPEAEAADSDEAEAEAEDDDADDEVSLDSAEAEFIAKFQDRPWARDDRGFIRKAREFAQTVLAEFGRQQETVDADILRDVLEDHDPERDVYKVRRAGEKLNSLAKDWGQGYRTDLADATVHDDATLVPAE